ncbi:AraC family transcriptional regulator [Clostridium sp. 'White wine YQ']|uniref:AraC family transcriptional regulator n=1 Tax=Clostridium sp. 'White wine YQ' TaxID=3027474 RepID=UPI0023666F70|nr:helix-turn-helix domain-containing protein [Clostridium sp. 'White wine YQ']MDD7793630.1 helix-turn-helix domain-containing protein [Clostridium sp. 'White wine YQ']
MIDLKDTIEECVEYIEDNIYNKISLDEISKETGISKYYLHRVFKSLTGESIIEYVQSRKLTSSINELVHTNKRIIDIAMDYGFNYEQSYIRAFKKKFGHTPLKVRTDDVSIVLTEKININDILAVDNSITYKPSFIFKQKFNIVGTEYKIMSKSGDNAANTYGREFFYNRKNEIPNPINSHIYIGYTDWSQNDNGYIYYMPSIQVTDLEHIPNGMKGVTIPANKYVVFRFVGFFNPDEIRGRHIGRVLAHLYRKWIYKSEFKFADSFRLEYIDSSLTKDNYCELDIYQPIE